MCIYIYNDLFENTELKLNEDYSNFTEAQGKKRYVINDNYEADRRVYCRHNNPLFGAVKFDDECEVQPLVDESVVNVGEMMLKKLLKLTLIQKELYQRYHYRLKIQLNHRLYHKDYILKHRH